MGTDLSTSDEWVEIAAIGLLPDEEIDLSGWALTYLASDGKESIITKFGSGFTIGYEQFLVISNFDAEHSRLEKDPIVVTSDVNLLNSKLRLRLIDPLGTVMDEVDDGVGNPFAGSNATPKASMERMDLSGSGIDPLNWSTAISSLGFDPGFQLLGTPGFANSLQRIQGFSSSESPLTSSSVHSSSFESSYSSSVLSSQSSTASQASYSSLATPSIYDSLLISEILADPKGADDEEWIEILNTGTENIFLDGLFLEEDSSTKWTFPQGTLLKAGEVLSFPKSITRINLKNTGGTVRILSGSTVLTEVTYPEAYEEVSFAFRDTVGYHEFSCIPSRDEVNSFQILNPRIAIQSGVTNGDEKVSLNLEAIVPHGSLSDARCRWDFGDGYTNDTCNPPSHTIYGEGNYDILLEVLTVCSDALVRKLPVHVSSRPSSSFSQESPVSSQEPASAGQAEDVSEEGDEEPSCTPSSEKQVLIFHEIFPSPRSGEQEWIELKNTSSQKVSLCGWTLDDVLDGGSSPVKFTEDIWIEPQGFLVLKKEHANISWNNSGDEAYLISPDGITVDSISYPSISTGISYSFFEGEWCKTKDISEGMPNRCSVELITKGTDSDHDFLLDENEKILKTDATHPDSDGDHFLDGFEISVKTDPLTFTEETIELLAAYQEFIIEKFNPKWSLLKTKGIKIEGKDFPFQSMELQFAGKNFSVTVKDNLSWAYYFEQSLEQGSHPVSFAMKDFAERDIVLENALVIELKEPFAGLSKKKAAVKKKASPIKTKYKNVVPGVSESGTSIPKAFSELEEQFVTADLPPSLITAGEGSFSSKGMFLGVGMILGLTLALGGKTGLNLLIQRYL